MGLVSGVDELIPLSPARNKIYNRKILKVVGAYSSLTYIRLPGHI